MAKTDQRTATCVSAPGKVLVAGGYLVLEQQYEGLVVATSSRFYAVVRDKSGTSIPSGTRKGSASKCRITVTAAQFPRGSSWSYLVSLHLSANRPEIHLEQTVSPESDELATQGRNKFIQLTLAKVLQFAWEAQASKRAGPERGLADQQAEEWVQAGQALLERIRGSEGQGMEVFVLADNDFYSQRETLSNLNLPPTITSLQSLAPFSPLPRPIGETNKTGLGSSAALVTSLVASLLHHLSLVSLSSPTPLDLNTVHGLAQLAHCQAQGKVGSGFDVSSAVYGSHRYNRFDPGCVNRLMVGEALPVVPLPLIGTLDEDEERICLIEGLSKNAWDHTARPFRLPKGLRLVLADVDAGTDTPSFVGRVLKFGKENPREKEVLYADLERANGAVRDAVNGVISLEKESEYAKELLVIKEKSLKELSDGELGKRIQSLADTLQNVRVALRNLGKAAGVPIEPEEQTRILDASCRIPGVIGGGVPGAGGYDALFLIIIDNPKTLSSLQDLWAGWTELKVSPLLAEQSDGGLRLEELANVKGLEQAVGRY